MEKQLKIVRNIRIPEDMLDRLKVYAKDVGFKVRPLIRKELDSYVKDQHKTVKMVNYQITITPEQDRILKENKIKLSRAVSDIIKRLNL